MILAWAHGLTNTEILRYADRIPGLGVVLYPRNYSVAADVPAIAYVPAPEHAEAARAHPFRGFICGRDEPNVDGPSGSPLPAAESRWQFAQIHSVIAPHPGFIAPASLGARGGFLRTLFHRQVFDHAYQEERGAAGVAWAPTRSTIPYIRGIIERYPGPHVLSPALFRHGWNRLMQPGAREFVALSSDRVHVAIWSLEQHFTQPEFGLFDTYGTITNVGEEVGRAIA